MISWIQRYFQHHFKTIFAVLLGVTIISFIFTIGASPGIGRADRQVIERQFFGYNLSLQDEQQRLAHDAELSASFNPPYGYSNLQDYAFARAASLYLADQWHIPAATDAEITDKVKTLRTFTGPDGQFDARAYATFLDNLKTKPRGGLSEGDIKHVLNDDIRVDKVEKLLAGPGYVLPSDIKKQLLAADTTWTIATAATDFAAFKPEIKPTDAELNKFFEENAARYEIPPRVVASYVEFPATSYLPAVTVTAEEVRAYYDQNPARFPKPTEVKPADAKTPPAPAKPDPAADFAAVRAQVESTLKLEKAKQLAVKAGSDLAVALFESKVTAPALDGFLAARKLTPRPLAPFTRDTGPAELGHSPEIAAEAFKLNPERFASEALPSPNGAVVLFWKDTQSARKPLFSEVREKVSVDYIENEKRRRFAELGRTIKSQVEARLKAGDPFEKAVATATSGTGLKFDVKTAAPFTLRSRPQDVDYSVLGALEHLEKGQVSDLVVNPDKGVFVFAADKKAPDLTESNPRYVETRTQLANYTAHMGAQAAISDLVEKELKKSEPKPE